MKSRKIANEIQSPLISMFCFSEYWEDHFQCRYPHSLDTPYNNYSRSCTGKERLTSENTQFEAQLQFVSDAVMAFAHAFK